MILKKWIKIDINQFRKIQKMAIKIETTGF